MRPCGYTRKGVSERLVVVKGWVIYVDSVVPAGYTPMLAGEGETLCFRAGLSRFVLPGPGSELVVVLIGTEVSNEDMGSHDWWPATKKYQLDLDWGSYSRVCGDVTERRIVSDRAQGLHYED